MIGLLRRSMYGTRDAPLNWQTQITNVLKQLGFRAGKSQPCVFVNKERGIIIVVHVDDFACVGAQNDLQWLMGGTEASLRVLAPHARAGGGRVQER